MHPVTRLLLSDVSMSPSHVSCASSTGAFISMPFPRFQGGAGCVGCFPGWCWELWLRAAKGLLLVPL